MGTTSVKRKAYLGLGSLQAFIGIGAVVGGFMLMIDPSGSKLGLPIDLIKGSPFSDFLIPGIFLFSLNGIGSMIGAGFSFAKKRYAQELAIILGAILVAWILIQVLIIHTLSWMHFLYVTLGVLELGFGFYLKRYHHRAAKQH
ncbi:MAG: hypothetical protein ACWGNV_04255 [Bacteroidales bacterium]